MTPIQKLLAIYRLLKMFAPFVGMVYDAVRDALPDGSKGEQKMDAFKAQYLHVVAEIGEKIEIAEAAWPTVQKLIENVHAIKKAAAAIPVAGTTPQ